MLTKIFTSIRGNLRLLHIL